MALPDRAPVMAQSTTPVRIAATISAKGMTTGVPPSAVTSSDWPTEEVRMRRPARSNSPLKASRQNTTCGG